MNEVQGGIFLNQSTKVHQVKVRSRASRLQEPLKPSVKPLELPSRERWGKAWLKADRLMRDLAVAGGLFLVVVAAKNATLPESQSVFGAIQTGAGMQWDESVGKLSFVNSFLPESIQSVWNEHKNMTVFAPVNGSIIHEWSQVEPYVMIDTGLSDVRASSNGEIINIAHGMDEERIVRLRHDDGSETIYGNLERCFMEIGDKVSAGDIIGKLLTNQPLAFEWRIDGRSVNPDGRMLPLTE